MSRRDGNGQGDGRDSAPPSREAILACLRKAGVPLTAAELIDRLAVRPAQREPLERRLAAMERDGQLMPNRKGVLLLASKLDFIAGRIQGHRDGFGFLIRDDGEPDMFLSPRQMQKAMHGDRVLVKEVGTDHRGRAEGAIVEVTERANQVLVGRFLDERGVNIVVPENQRIKHDILIPPGDAGGARHGQVVTCEIVDPPSGHSQPIGRIVEVLGEIDDPGMEIEIAVRKFDVPHEFSDAALAQAARLPGQVRPADLRRRVDLRDIAMVTIDGEDARDFDDAVYCERIADVGGRRGAGWRLLVGIADVAHYVRPGDAIDADALERTTSVYFPRRVIPMLPESLSNGLCSLNPAVDRLVLVCDMVIDDKGVVRAYQFYEAVIHSAARLTYGEVWNALSGQPSTLPGAIRERLDALYALFRVQVTARRERGAIEIDTTETSIVCDAAGRILRIEPTHRNDAHRLIEECMLAANTCAADFMQRGKHPALYRVHEGPTQDRLATLREFLRGVGLSLGAGEDPTPADYAALAQKIQGRPDADLLQTMLLRSMQQAIYTPDNVGHFGLAYEAYAHFTSPIRRYPDLLTHRVIKALIRGERFRLSGRPARGKGADEAETDAWQAIGTTCSANERRADEASRDVEAWLKCQYMREHVGEQFSGRITGVAPFGIFVTLDTLFVEGLVHVSELGGEYFQFNEAGHELRGERTGQRYRLTDPIDVQVSRVDLEARRIEFRLVPRTGYRELVEKPRRGDADPMRRPPRKAAPAKSEAASSARAARLAERGSGRKAAGGKPGRKAAKPAGKRSSRK
ncbi:MAG: ribonuclease R [Burkholderiaceae bacterium]|jgi:ribonuclease R|nr:ribonuclease R [Burkholderiaceae bacterium]MEB2319362.1 ribonuclease R [Pseudomonadota bacterium]